MSKITEYDHHDAVGLAELVRKRQVSPEELLDEAVRRVEALNPKLNAVVYKMYDRAKADIRAGLPDGPFRGVPWVLKDLGTAYRGTPTTYGCALFKDNVPDHDSELIIRYKRAGLVIFAKTATPEFGLTTSTESRLYGPTRNPWKPEHTPGGSSGGSAAAVAAGIVPAADGSDGGGSIRIPASCCGLVGLKPTRARISMAPDKGESWSGLSTGGQLSRTVRDTAALLDATHGPAPGDPYVAPTPNGPYLAEAGRDPGRLRIAFHATPFNGSECAPECRAAVEDAAKLCASLGHHVEEKAFGVDVETLNRAVRIIVGAQTRRTIDDRAKELGRPFNPEADVEPLTYGVYKNAERYTAADYVFALNTIHAAGRAVARFFELFDLMLTPTMGMPPARLGGVLSLSHPDGKVFGRAIAQTVGFTQFFNVTGSPAISLPLYWADGLPIGVQVAADAGREDLLIRLAAQLEQARPWSAQRPALA